VSGAAEAAYASSTERAADMSASAKPASMSATEPATMSTTEPATMSTTAAARKRISGQSGGESGSRREDDHRLT
jgi:hypothetical protein